MHDRPLHRPYARLELERRFLLEVLPPEAEARGFVRLHDRFVTGTHLRLRHVRASDGRWLATKLGQKIPNPEAPEDPRQRQMTTLYLPEAEGAALAPLSGVTSVKRRYELPEQGFTWCIDVWEAPAAAAGVILAEVEAPTLEELECLLEPAWAAREVTDDPGYSAFALAQRGREG